MSEMSEKTTILSDTGLFRSCRPIISNKMHRSFSASVSNDLESLSGGELVISMQLLAVRLWGLIPMS